MHCLCTNNNRTAAATQWQAMFEVRLQQKQANTTCWVLLHAHADPLRPMTPFVGAVHKAFLRLETSCIKQFVDQCSQYSMLCYVHYRSYPECCLTYLFRWSAAFLRGLLHISLQTRCTTSAELWGWLCGNRASCWLHVQCTYMTHCFVASWISGLLWLAAISTLQTLQCQVLQAWLAWRSGQLQASAPCHVLLTSAARSEIFGAPSAKRAQQSHVQKATDRTLWHSRRHNSRATCCSIDIQQRAIEAI